MEERSRPLSPSTEPQRDDSVGTDDVLVRLLEPDRERTANEYLAGLGFDPSGTWRRALGLADITALSLLAAMSSLNLDWVRANSSPAVARQAMDRDLELRRLDRRLAHVRRRAWRERDPDLLRRLDELREQVAAARSGGRDMRADPVRSVAVIAKRDLAKARAAQRALAELPMTMHERRAEGEALGEQLARDVEAIEVIREVFSAPARGAADDRAFLWGRIDDALKAAGWTDREIVDLIKDTRVVFANPPPAWEIFDGVDDEPGLVRDLRRKIRRHRSRG
jgi:hypothetical protein